MQITSHKISPCLWFDTQAEDAARFYTSIFENSRLGSVSRYDEPSAQASGQTAGAVMTVQFELAGQTFFALNGGPHFTFNEAISFQVYCDSQEEVDRLWRALSEGGDPRAQQCGWLKDRFGLSWQIIPKRLFELLTDPDRAKAKRVTEAMLRMKKIEIAGLEAAYNGTSETTAPDHAGV